MKHKIWISSFVLSFILISASIGFFNYKVDSLAILGNTTLDKVAKELSKGRIIAGLSNIDERLFRKKSIEYLEREIDIIAIGSSRTMQLRKNMITNDEEDNFYNYSVSGASLEDYMALLQVHKNKFNSLPKIIILGIDPWVFNQNSGQTRFLSLKKEYEDFLFLLENKKPIFLQQKNKFSQMFSISYLKTNLKTVSKKQQFYIVDTIDTDAALKMPDGSIYYPYDTRYPNFEKVEKNAKAYASGSVYSLEKFNKISNIELFESFIIYLKNQDSIVYFYLPPYNPITYDILISKEKYQTINSVEKYLVNFAEQNNIELIGSYNPHKYGFSNSDFSDGMHSLDVVYEIIFKDLF